MKRGKTRCGGTRRDRGGRREGTRGTTAFSKTHRKKKHFQKHATNQRVKSPARRNVASREKIISRLSQQKEIRRTWLVTGNYSTSLVHSCSIPTVGRRNAEHLRTRDRIPDHRCRTHGSRMRASHARCCTKLSRRRKASLRNTRRTEGKYATETSGSHLGTKRCAHTIDHDNDDRDATVHTYRADLDQSARFYAARSLVKLSIDALWSIDSATLFQRN